MFGFAKKIGMTRLFVDGKAVAVTLLQFEKQQVIQRKTLEKDGYEAVQIGSFHKKSANNALKGHLKKYTESDDVYACIGEFKVKLEEDKKTITVEDFLVGDSLKISGTTKGRGFAGPVKRYNFRGQPASHGHDHKRGVGSIGMRWPQRVLPGTRMAGHMGSVRRTVTNLKIVSLDVENNLIIVAGSVAGPNSGFLEVKKMNYK